MLRTEQVTVRFGGLVAVDHVSIEIPEGRITGLIGPNGAGKTTLFNCLSGVQRMTEGKIIYQDRDITGIPGYKACEAGIARTYQVINLFHNMTVLENVLIGRHCRIQYGFWGALFHSKAMRAEEEHAKEEAFRCLKAVGLGEKKDLKAGQLPYGEQRMLEIARALATGPKLLLLDEPAAGMNDTEKSVLNALIKKILTMGITILLIEHDMKVVMGISDYIYVMNNGKLLAQGKPEEVQNNPEVIKAYLGEG